MKNLFLNFLFVLSALAVSSLSFAGGGTSVGGDDPDELKWDHADKKVYNYGDVFNCKKTSTSSLTPITQVTCLSENTCTQIEMESACPKTTEDQ